MSRRVTGEDYDILISYWRKWRDLTTPGTKDYQRILDKIEMLERFRREEFGPRVGQTETDRECSFCRMPHIVYCENCAFRPEIRERYE